MASYSGPPANDRGAEYALPTWWCGETPANYTCVTQIPKSLGDWWRLPMRTSPKRTGAFFVRSRDTGGGATSVQLLYPESNVWPLRLTSTK